MSLIRKISELQHPGAFHDFTWPKDLPVFAHYNLIFGPNASGKTIVSRVFRYLEKRDPPPTQVSVKLCIEGRTLDGHDFREVPVSVRVFNRDFVDENVFPVGGGDVPFILVLGKESVSKKQQVQELNEERSAKAAELYRAIEAKEQAAKDLDRYCIDQARNIKREMRGASSGLYDYYHKGHYQEAAEDMMANGNPAAHRLESEQRDSWRRQLKEEIKQPIAEAVYSLPSVSVLSNRVTTILAKIVTTLVIPALKKDPNLGEWTRTGLGLHEAYKTKVCLFCGQDIPEKRLAVLEAHFSKAFDQFIQELEQQVVGLEAVVDKAKQVSVPHSTDLYDHLREEYDIAKTALNEALASVQTYAANLASALGKKKKHPFQKLGLDVAAPVMAVDVVTKLNQVIQRHNKASNNFDDRRAKAEKYVIDDLIARRSNEYSRLVTAKKKADSDEAALRRDINTLSSKITRLEAEIHEYLDPDELNEELEKYLGHSDFRLEIRDSGYQIMRGNVLAGSMSEGEKTALALLYFLKSLRDDRFALSKGVVVLDDPVSSLDSNALYLAFGYIKERTNDAAQLFVLTHNFAFFRLVRRWFHHIKGQRKKDIDKRPARFYMLERVFDPPTPHTVIQILDPLLEQYESEYQYLFARIFNAAQRTRIPLQEAYVLSNVSRRLLEAFLAFRYPNIHGELHKKMERVEFKEATKTRIGQFVNTYSHDHIIDEPTHSPSVFGESRSVLNDILDLIESEDPKHFEAMTQLVETRHNDVE